MASYHLSVKVIGRSSGRSSVGASAYRTGEKLTNEYDGVTHDYLKKGGIVYSEIMLPQNAPESFQDRNTLWNAVEKSERRKDAQTAREIEIALPKELSREQQIKLVGDYTRETFVAGGMCADIAIHDKEDGNPHAHIMLATREVSENGFEKKNRDWNNRENTELWRDQWAQIQNKALECAGVDERVDHRSYERQGKVQIPTIHLGTSATQIEKRGEQSERGKHNEEVRAINAEYLNSIKELEKDVHDYKEQQAKEQAQTAQPQQPPQGVQILGAVRNPEREDEEIAWNWQKSGGLERAEASLSKAEEMESQPAKRKESDASHAAAPADPRELYPTAEQTAKKINAFKAEYIGLELKIHEQQTIKSKEQEKIRDEVRKLNGKIEDIKESTQNIGTYSQKIEELQSNHSKLGIFFARKKKRELDEQIKQIEKSKTQAIQSLQKNYGITPEQSTAKIQELQRQVNEKDTLTMDEWKGVIEKQKTPTGIIAELWEQQGIIAAQYKQVVEAAVTHPEKEKIMQLTDRITHNARRVDERLAIGVAESKLKDIFNKANNSRAQTKKIDRGMER